MLPTNTMSSYLTQFTDSTDDDTSDSLAGALRVIAGRYGVDSEELVTRDVDGRTVIWLDHESAESGDVAKEVAEVRAV